MRCPHCHKNISPSLIAKSIAKQGGGRKRVLKACEFCGKEFGAREMRVHLPHCPKR